MDLNPRIEIDHEKCDKLGLCVQICWEYVIEQADKDSFPITHVDPSETACPLEDATIATYQMMLMAHSLGLGTCFSSNFYENANASPGIREILAVLPENTILMSFTLGYPAIRFRTMIDRYEPEVRWLG